MTFLKITGLRKRFGALEILKGIDLELEKGGFLVLVGPSGTGVTVDHPVGEWTASSDPTARAAAAGRANARRPHFSCGWTRTDRRHRKLVDGLPRL